MKDIKKWFKKLDGHHVLDDSWRNSSMEKVFLKHQNIMNSENERVVAKDLRVITLPKLFYTKSFM